MLIFNDCARLLQFSIIDKQKNDDDMIIANKNIDIMSIFTINCLSLILSYSYSVQLCGFWTLPQSLRPVNPDPSLANLMKQLSNNPLLYIGFGSMETFMLDVNWEALLVILTSGMLDIDSLTPNII